MRNTFASLDIEGKTFAHKPSDHADILWLPIVFQWIAHRRFQLPRSRRRDFRVLQVFRSHAAIQACTPNQKRNGILLIGSDSK